MNQNKASVLVIDDEADIRELLRTIFEDASYHCAVAAGVEEALTALSAREFDLVFSDIRMPGRPVAELLGEIKRHYSRIPVIMVTALNSTDSAIDYLRMGATDYIVKPFNLNEVLVAADRAMEKKRLDLANHEFQNYLEQRVEDRAAQAHRLFCSITQILIRLLELRTPLDIGHAMNVAEIARRVAFEFKITKDDMRKVYLAALLHDVGMIPIEDLLIQKRGSLTPAEYQQIQEHSALAESVLKPILEDREVLKYIRHHHERYDGAGYPDGLKGNIIPLGARIVAVAEAFDAMTRSRPYRDALSPRRALAELERCADSQFDPKVVAVFSRIFEQIVSGRQASSRGTF